MLLYYLSDSNGQIDKKAPDKENMERITIIDEFVTTRIIINHSCYHGQQYPRCSRHDSGKRFCDFARRGI